jgi:hypothetical protein
LAYTFFFNSRPSLSDISDNTYTLGFYIPNTTVLTASQGGGWQNYVTSVNEVERLTGYDFFANIRSGIQELIEGNSTILLAPDTDLRAPLLADFSIGHNSFEQSDRFVDISSTSTFQISPTQVRLTEVAFTESSTSQLRITQVGADQTSLANYGTAKISLNKTGLIKAGFTNTSPSEVSSAEICSDCIDAIHQSPLKIGINQDSLIQTTTIQDSTTQGSTFKIASIETAMSQVSSSKTNTLKIDVFENAFGQSNSSKIPLPSSITLQQFLSSHNFSLQNTTIPTWTEFLTGTTPFNLNIAITDLPTGQLAEANITHFDSNGRPTSGTLTLDTDANGLGWFIDSSPWDNAEFGTLNAETFFRATLGSEAYGHYDLLTTILHELGHLAGLISGNPTYDSRVQTINGNPIFQGNGYSTTLTTDRSHLADPTKLMGTYLAPGMRKLPSQLELQMLADLDTRGSIQVTNAAPAKTIPTILNLLCNAV